LVYTNYQVEIWGKTVNITINKIQAILFSNILFFGLTACSSEPAPWTRPDESPWSEKHAAAEASVEDVEVIEEPLMIVEPEPMPEPSRFEEPEPIVAAIAVPEPEPVPMTAEEQILSMDSGYAVQIFASSSMSSMDNFRANNGLDDMLAVKTDREGSVVYVLVSTHTDRASANLVAEELEQRTGTKPWVRSILGLQKVVYQ
jgi:septal ring-binding cell division protein DamX